MAGNHEEEGKELSAKAAVQICELAVFRAIANLAAGGLLPAASATFTLPMTAIVHYIKRQVKKN